MERLIYITGHVGTCYLGVARNGRVCDAATQARWMVRENRIQHFHEFHARIQSVPVPDDNLGGDTVLWKHYDDRYKPCFSSTRT